MDKPLPIGIEDFGELIRKGYYYIDKTGLICDLLDHGGKTTLFTRPRRFGKTLNLSMLQYFFEQPSEGESWRGLFDGLQVASAGEKYMAHQGQYPVVSLSLKSARQPNFEMAYASVIDEIAKEFVRHSYVLSSDCLTEAYRSRYEALMNLRAMPIDYAKALAFLSQCLAQYHGRKVIILLDEYDVPLENAYYRGYYEDMTDFIRSLFESALKTNASLELAVVTGCLRISKESIFTGLNNFKIVSILDKEYEEYFGFTQNEVEALLKDFHRCDHLKTVQEWYDGYLFGDGRVYNPWSVINFVDRLRTDPQGYPTALWANTSANTIVRDLIYHATTMTRGEIQRLIDGQTIEKPLQEDITYGDMDQSADSLWNVLLFTGYLTVAGVRMQDHECMLTLTIPNVEVLTIYTHQIQTWFRDSLKTRDMSSLAEALQKGDAQSLQEEIGALLRDTISYMDSKETFYHGFLLGVLASLQSYKLKSNREADNGRYDISLYTDDVRIPPIILELKVAERFEQLQVASQRALRQIQEKGYAQAYAEDGYQQVLCYGLGFFRKQVSVCCRKVDTNNEPIN